MFGLNKKQATDYSLIPIPAFMDIMKPQARAIFYSAYENSGGMIVVAEAIYNRAMALFSIELEKKGATQKQLTTMLKMSVSIWWNEFVAENGEWIPNAFSAIEYSEADASYIDAQTKQVRE